MRVEKEVSVNDCHFGTPSKCFLDNEWSDDEVLNQAAKSIMEDAITEYFNGEIRRYGRYDFGFAVSTSGDIYFSFGHEPSYQFQQIRIITICTKKELSCIQEGIGVGYYGSEIRGKTRCYKNYERDSKFTRSIDKWHALLIEALNKSKGLKNKTEELNKERRK